LNGLQPEAEEIVISTIVTHLQKVWTTEN